VRRERRSGESVEVTVSFLKKEKNKTLRLKREIPFIIIMGDQRGS
jgi:hypothetical protein